MISRLLQSALILLSILLLTACTLFSQRQNTTETDSQTSTELSTTVELTNDPQPVQQPPPRPKIKLTQDILFKILIAEFAGYRNKLNIAVENYLDLAKSTRDPMIIERAAHIAEYVSDNDAAFEAANLWLEVDPKNLDAHQILVVTLLRRGELDQASQHMKIILKMTKGKFDKKLGIIGNLLNPEHKEDQAVLMQLVERLIENRVDSADEIYNFAGIIARTGDMDRSRELLERVLELNPDNELVIKTYLSLLKKMGNIDDALIWLEDVLKDRKDDLSLRITYARLLMHARRFNDARRQFEILTVQVPNHTDILYTLGILYLQDNHFDTAEQYFMRLNKLKKKLSNVNYYLGHIAEKKEQLDKANDFYQEVHDGENYFNAQVRLSLILAKQGQVEKALANIRVIKQSEDVNHLILINVEAQILIEQKRYSEAMDVLNDAIEEQSHPDLLYSRAMLAGEIDRLDILESDLKAIIAEDANNAVALNALGYALADQTNRYKEALDYIQRAYELEPEDFYILDSMGWIMYRLGRLEEAADFLKKAFALKNDPEIASHLGEVLWVMGDKEAAKRIWEMALQKTPTDERLLKTIDRFKP